MTTNERISAQSLYHPGRATLLAHASEVVYRGPARVESMTQRHWGESDFRFFDIDSTQCSLAANYDEIVVCFRGTEKKLDDWVIDLDCSLVSGPLGGKVHQGFYDALAMVWGALHETVAKLMAERPRQLWLTGHSLGGALAMLAAAKWTDEGMPVTGIHTFGQPRVGDNEFARNYDFKLRQRSFRHVNHLDIVTRTPPRAMGYSHAGTLVYFTENGEVEHDGTWWRKFLSGWCGAFENILDWCGEGVRDHRMTEYVAILESIAPAMAPQGAPRLSLYAPPGSLLAPRRRRAA
ncbi:MAG: lipase family protein [Planctomycetales bacterium]|nr:lipase family protein [Planctomycetales bacterium]